MLTGLGNLIHYFKELHLDLATSLFANVRAVKIQAPKCHCQLCVNELEKLCVSLCSVCVCVLCDSVVVQLPSRVRLLQSHGLQPSRLLCPWDFPGKEYCSGLPCPPPGDLPNPGIDPGSPALQSDSLPSELPGKPHCDTIMLSDKLS